jgi:hypothetical protein
METMTPSKRSKSTDSVILELPFSHVTAIEGGDDGSFLRQSTSGVGCHYLAARVAHDGRRVDALYSQQIDEGHLQCRADWLGELGFANSRLAFRLRKNA